MKYIFGHFWKQNLWTELEESLRCGHKNQTENYPGTIQILRKHFLGGRDTGLVMEGVLEPNRIGVIQ